MIWYFVFFFVSGFCSLLYELVWLRLAMAQFGVTTALVSIVLAVVHGRPWSWLVGGRNADAPPWRSHSVAAAATLCVYRTSDRHLCFPRPGSTWVGASTSWRAGCPGASSGSFYLVSGAWLALTLIPWSACMGATIPSRCSPSAGIARCETRRSFSFLYLANVLGAVTGAIAPLSLSNCMAFTARCGSAPF